MKGHPFATKLPENLIGALNDTCERFGLRKNFVVEEALREKIEDLWDSYDLKEAIEQTTGFRDWADVKKELFKKCK
jgi:predicted DNA-binding protein